MYALLIKNKEGNLILEHISSDKDSPMTIPVDFAYNYKVDVTWDSVHQFLDWVKIDKPSWSIIEKDNFEIRDVFDIPDKDSIVMELGYLCHITGSDTKMLESLHNNNQNISQFREYVFQNLLIIASKLNLQTFTEDKFR